jgi:NAD-dependent SIR2 family protein deacetylase
MELAALFDGKKVVALTGAGISVESGIPAYRGVGAPERSRPPMYYREFSASEAAQKRYWARSYAGFPRFSAAKPNTAHQVLAELEQRGLLHGVITQNVDGLHNRAGSRRVIALHGTIFEARCASCGAIEDRSEVQVRLSRLNPDLSISKARQLADGDAELNPSVAEELRLAGCLVCDGLLRPNVVFFGENVPREVSERAYQLADEAEALFVAGSSLAVFSGFRFVRRAHEKKIPIAIVNLGPTRGDPYADLVIDASASETLAALLAAL